MGTRKQIAVEEFLKTPILAGQLVSVRGLGLQDKNQFGDTVEIKEVITNTDGTVDLLYKRYRHDHELTLVKSGDYIRSHSHIGANVISRPEVRTNTISFDLNGLISRLRLKDKDKHTTIDGVKILEVNWNPYVINANGEKEYYQRDFVWTVEQNQHLIESIYNNIDCGKVLVRHRSWTEIEEVVKSGGDTSELSFIDIIDGKQRLNAIRGFLTDEFPDHLGNYYSDLSQTSQRIFNTTMLISYAEIDGSVPDSFVISQFLKLNFMGVPQSKEHIEFVRAINQRL